MDEEIDDYVDQEEVHEALKIFIEIEPNPEDPDGDDRYDEALKTRADEIKKARDVLERYAVQQAGPLLQMQEAFYDITNSERYIDDVIKICVVRAELNDAFDGKGEWQK